MITNFAGFAVELLVHFLQLAHNLASGFGLPSRITAAVLGLEAGEAARGGHQICR